MDLKTLIDAEDIKKALRSYLGCEKVPDFDFEVKRGTEKVQGLLSLVLRVGVTFTGEKGSKEEVSFIVKRPPISELQIRYTKGSDFYARESAFFNTAYPILLKNSRKNELPLVKCFHASDQVVILEDLSTTGHEIVSKPVTDDNYCSLDLQFIDLIFRKTAVIHAASLGQDWLKILPKLATDGLYEGHGRNLMEPRIKNGCLFISEIMKLHFPEAFLQFGQWVTSDLCYPKIIEFSKPSQNKWRNVLCHGDIWENNVMFRLDKDGQPLDLKMIDLQIVRFCPASIDLHFFLDLCSDRPFRDAHEKGLLASYVDEFNLNIPEGTPKLEFERFKEEYDQTRLIGTLLAATIRPASFLEGWVAENDGEVNEKVVSTFIDGLPVETLMKSFEENQSFRGAILLLVEELIAELGANKICPIK